jgi:hypothetical protein
VTPEQMTKLFSPDLNLSPEARSLIAHVSTLEEAEIPYPRLLRLLQVADEKKLRRAIAEAEDVKWIQVTRQTGRGHHPRFTFTPPEIGSLSDQTPENTLPEIGTLSDSPPENGKVNADRVPENGKVNGAPSSPTSSPSPVRAHARGPAPDDDRDVRLLRDLLTPYDAPIDRLYRSTATTSWGADIWGWYHPASGGSEGGGTQLDDFRGLEQDEWIQALATAIADYASEGKPWDRRLFRGFVRTAAREARRAKSSMSREQKAEQEVAAAPAISTPSREQLPPEEREWLTRVEAALETATEADPAVAEWREFTAEHLRRLHQDDREFKAMRPGDQREHIHIRVLRAYGDKIGDRRPGGRRTAVAR